MDRSPVSPSASQPRRAVPHYFLYGEHASRAAPGFVHIETLSSRSALHGWEIAPHLHDGLQQVLWVREGGGEARLDRDRVAFVAPALIVVPAAAVHGFTWGVFCDWFIELAKPVLNGEDGAEKAEIQGVAQHVLGVVLRLLHPVMPLDRKSVV